VLVVSVVTVAQEAARMARTMQLCSEGAPVWRDCAALTSEYAETQRILADVHASTMLASGSAAHRVSSGLLSVVGTNAANASFVSLSWCRLRSSSLTVTAYLARGWAVIATTLG
jgi:hypothetical protein